MALPKKKTRRISVNDTDFRWGSFTSNSVVEVRAELFDQPQSQLVVPIEPSKHGRTPIVGPGLAAALIREALKRGWAPEVREPREFALGEIHKLVADHDLRSRKSLICVIIAPLDAGASRVRDTLTRTVRELGLQVRDVADVPADSSLVASVTAWINDADLVIADVSRSNPNVFFEIGYAHALGKPTIHVLEESEDRGVPTALSGNLFVLYSLNNLTSLHDGLKKAILRFIRSDKSR